MTYQPLPLAERITVHERPVDTGSPPDGLLTLEDVGLLSVPGVQGQVIYRAPGTLFETRATVTPGGDYLLMFPTDSADHDPAEGNCHYGRADRKVNDLVALRSSDGGESLTRPPHRLRHRLQPARLRAVHPARRQPHLRLRDAADLGALPPRTGAAGKRPDRLPVVGR